MRYLSSERHHKKKSDYRHKMHDTHYTHDTQHIHHTRNIQDRSYVHDTYHLHHIHYVRDISHAIHTHSSHSSHTSQIFYMHHIHESVRETERETEREVQKEWEYNKTRGRDNERQGEREKDGDRQTPRQRQRQTHHTHVTHAPHTPHITDTDTHTHHMWPWEPHFGFSLLEKSQRHPWLYIVRCFGKRSQLFSRSRVCTRGRRCWACAQPGSEHRFRVNSQGDRLAQGGFSWWPLSGMHCPPILWIFMDRRAAVRYCPVTSSYLLAFFCCLVIRKAEDYVCSLSYSLP